MTTFNPSQKVTKEAAKDFTDLRYTFVTIDTDGKVTTPSAITNQIFGVIQNEPVTGQAASIQPLGSGGTSLIVLGATLDEGVMVSTEAATGKAIAAASTAVPVGPLLQGGAEDEYGEVLLSSSTVDA